MSSSVTAFSSREEREVVGGASLRGSLKVGFGLGGNEESLKELSSSSSVKELMSSSSSAGESEKGVDVGGLTGEEIREVVDVESVLGEEVGDD